MPDPTPHHPAADRNLLFGVLALQMDFVGRDALVQAMNAWALDKATPLGQILVRLGHLSPERYQLLDALVAEHLRAHQGDPRQSLAVASTPLLIRRDLQAIADPAVQASLAGLAGPGDTDPEAPGPYRPRTADASGQRYRVLRPHAKGGLGEVFVAEDTDLHREVALKEIQPQLADDPRSRQRFLLEAEVNARLEHPGIVPVYGLGVYPTARPSTPCA